MFAVMGTIWKWMSEKPERWFLPTVLLLTFLLYLGSRPKEFTNWDDNRYIVNNEMIRSISFGSLYDMAARPFFSNYAPLTIFSFALDYHFWGLNPAAFHFHNVALHLGCIMLVYFLLKSMQLDLLILLPAVALFALHPTNTETVSWASERKNLLAALFFFASFLSYIRYRAQHERLNYLLSTFFFLLSLLSKASAVLAPALFLSYDYFYGKNKIRNLPLYDKMPFIAMAEIMGFWTIHAAQVEDNLHSYHHGTRLLSVVSSGHLLGEYSALLLWPFHLSVLHLDHGLTQWDRPALWLGALLFLSVVILIFGKFKSSAFWFVFFILFMLPVLNFVPLPAKMANRYLYIPQVAFWVVGGSLMAGLLSRLRPFKLARSLLVAALGAWLALLCFGTYQAAQVWRNSATLWANAIEKDPNAYSAYYNLGQYYQGNSQTIGQSAAYFQTSVLLDPDNYEGHFALGTYYYCQKKLYPQAIDEFLAAINIHPEADDVISNLGCAYAQAGQLRRALYTFYRATYINPMNLSALDNIAQVYLRIGEYDHAQAMAQHLILQFPDSSTGFLRLSECLANKKDYPRAFWAWREYLKREYPKVDTQKMEEEKINELHQKGIVLPPSLLER